MARLESQLPPRCPRCGSRQNVWSTSIKPIEQIIRGALVELEGPITNCNHCGLEVLTDDQVDKLFEERARLAWERI
jgi:hypothetical protein